MLLCAATRARGFSAVPEKILLENYFIDRKLVLSMVDDNLVATNDFQRFRFLQNMKFGAIGGYFLNLPNHNGKNGENWKASR